MVKENVIFSDFSEKMAKELSNRLGEDYHIIPQTITKNNTVTYDMLSIRKENEAVSPVIYLDEHFKSYQNGASIQEIAGDILGIYQKGKDLSPAIPSDFMMDFAQVKDRICFKLVNASLNSSILSDIPHVDYLDLAVVFIVVLSDSDSGFSSVTIKNGFLDIWETNESDLYKIALENAARMLGSMICPIESIICKMTGIADIPPLDNRLFVATNRQKLHGAGVILYPGLLKDFSKEIGEDLYILPSSIHECLFIPHSFVSDPLVLKDMVSEVNRTQVLPEEVLSDSVYYYSSASDKVEIL